MTWPSADDPVGGLRVFRHLRALFEHDRRVVGEEPDQLLAVRRQHVGAGERALADEILLGLPDRPVEAEVGERHRAVGLLADDDEALLGPHHMHRLGAVGAAAVLLDLAPRRLPNGAAVMRGHVDLVAELAGEAHPHQPRRNAADARLAHGHMGKASLARSTPSTSGATQSRAFGPCTAIVAHCSVVEVSQTLRSVNSVWR